MFCSKCGNSNDEAASFCAKCGTPLVAAGGTRSAAGATAASETATMRGQAHPTQPGVAGKNPTVALVLSIFFGFVGAGQFFNGDWKKGLAMAAASLLLGIPSSGVVLLGVWVWSAIDAYQVASGKWSAW